MNETFDLNKLKWTCEGLVPVIAQDKLTGEVRMFAYANREALELTLQTHEAHFFSRSRNSLWKKGESSGHTLQVTEIWTDCDADVVLYMVLPTGPTCHTGQVSCFFRSLMPASEVGDAYSRAMPVIGQLQEKLLARKTSSSDESYTRSLLDSGPTRIIEKIIEESRELTEAVQNESDARVASESADLLYHVLVALLHREIPLDAISRVLLERFRLSGHAEKQSRSP